MSIAVPRRDGDELAAVVAGLQGSSDPVLDLTSGCLIAFLTKRHCPLRHAYFWRGFLTEWDQRGEIRALSQHPPPVAVRTHRGRDQFRWDSIVRYAPSSPDGLPRTTQPPRESDPTKS